jgi:DNA polymerase sigma
MADLKVFGSCLTGLALPESDLDLCITGFESCQAEDIGEIIRILEI